MSARRFVPWLLTLGLAITTFAGVWQELESRGREDSGGVVQPYSVPSEPAATLVDRIRASWEPGDRLRTALLFAGLALCAAAACRAWRVEGFSAASLRRVALALAVLGASFLALGLLRARTHPRQWSSERYVSAHDVGGPRGHERVAIVHEPVAIGRAPKEIGPESIDGEAGPPAGVAPLTALGKVWLGLGALLGLLSLLYLRRAPRTADTSPARSTPRGGGG